MKKKAENFFRFEGIGSAISSFRNEEKNWRTNPWQKLLMTTGKNE